MGIAYPRLVGRRGRHILLTADGEQVAGHAALIAAQTVAVEQLGRSSATDLRSHVRISAPPALSSALLAQPIAEVRREHPAIHITLVGKKWMASLDRG